MSRVSAVVVNYNRAEMLSGCIQSLLDQTRPPDEIVVLDNGSADGSADLVRERFGGRVRLIQLQYNAGFARGNNQAVKQTTGEWLALINNDARAEPDWLERMIEAAGAGPRVGLVACRILRGDAPGLLDNVGVRLWPDGISRGAYHFEKDSEVRGPEVLIPSGAAMLVRRAAFDEAGGFDPEFFAYSEDTDLGLKIRLLAYDTALADRARVIHTPGGGTLQMLGPRKVYLVERNRISILLRFFPWTCILASPLYTALRYAALIIGVEKAKQNKRRRGSEGATVRARHRPAFSGVGAVFKAYLHAVKRLPADYRCRREWVNRRKVHPQAMRQWIKNYRLEYKSLAALEPP